MNLTAYAANAILDSTPLPATLYLAVHTGNPGPAGALNASSAPRVSFARTAAVDGFADAAADLTVTPTASETWTHASVHDAATGGNCWFVGELAVAVEAAGLAGQSIAASSLTITFEIWS